MNIGSCQPKAQIEYIAFLTKELVKNHTYAHPNETTGQEAAN